MINPETQNKQPLLQYVQTFSFHTSWSHACTPSTTIKIHPGNSQPPVQPHVNPHNIPRLHFSLSIDATYTDHNQQPTEHHRSTASYFVIHLFFLIIIHFSKKLQQVYYVLKPVNIITVRTYPVCGPRVFPFELLLFLEREKKTACLWRLANLFPPPSWSLTYSFYLIKLWRHVSDDILPSTTYL